MDENNLENVNNWEWIASEVLGLVGGNEIEHVLITHISRQWFLKFQIWMCEGEEFLKIRGCHQKTQHGWHETGWPNQSHSPERQSIDETSESADKMLSTGGDHVD